jgi:hypothetical protein
MRRTFTSTLFVSKALYLVIVYHTDCLHKGVADGGADKLETAFEQVFAHGIGLLSACWNAFNRFDFMIDWPAAYKLPDVGVKGTEFFLDFQKRFGILDRSCDLQAITDNTGISKKPLYVFCLITSDFVRMEAVKRHAVVLTVVQNGLPVKACLGTLKNKEFKERAVVMHWHTPFLIVICGHEHVFYRPATVVFCLIDYFHFLCFLSANMALTFLEVVFRKSIDSIFPAAKNRQELGKPPQWLLPSMVLAPYVESGSSGLAPT